MKVLEAAERVMRGYEQSSLANSIRQWIFAEEEAKLEKGHS